MEKLGARVLGVSADSPQALARFREKYGLNFPLASDEGRSMLDRYGVWQEKNLYGKKSMGIVRTTYLLGPDGTVRHIFQRVKVDGHIDEVLESLQQ